MDWTFEQKRAASLEQFQLVGSESVSETTPAKITKAIQSFVVDLGAEPAMGVPVFQD